MKRTPETRSVQLAHNRMVRLPEKIRIHRSVDFFLTLPNCVVIIFSPKYFVTVKSGVES